MKTMKKTKIRAIESKNDTFGLVLRMMVVTDTETKTLSNLILDILPCEKNRNDELSKINFDKKNISREIDPTKEGIVTVGDNFTAMVPSTARKQIILDYPSSQDSKLGFFQACFFFDIFSGHFRPKNFCDF